MSSVAKQIATTAITQRDELKENNNNDVNHCHYQIKNEGKNERERLAARLEYRCFGRRHMPERALFMKINNKDF